MNRKVLLVEPNYKNKYPPMGLMKLATYYRESGDDVRFFKGDLLDLAADIVVEDLLNALTTLDAETNWKADKKILVECVRKGTISLLDEQAHFQNNLDAIELVKNARSFYRKIYRFMFKENLAKEWEEKFWSLPAEELEEVKSVVAVNKFKDLDFSKYSKEVRDVLQYYMVTRDEAEQMLKEKSK